MTVPMNFAPVAFVRPGPERRKPSVAERSFTVIENFPAARPAVGLSEIDAPGPIAAASFVGAGAGGGGTGVVSVAVPTVNFPFIWVGCASQLKMYVPSTSETLKVESAFDSIGVATSTPGPPRRKLWKVEWSWTTSVYVPTARCVTA